MGKIRRPLTAPAREPAWQPLPGGWAPPPAVLAETLDGGQAFRWQHDPAGIWTGLWAGQVVQLRPAAGRLTWRTVSGNEASAASALRAYLALDTDWTTLADTLPWRRDAHLAAALRAFPGLRILRQPFGETLLAFLCSATKRIGQIKQMLARLATRHGAPLDCRGLPGGPYFRLPTWAELAAVPEAGLRRCGLGFRARYIHATACFLAAHPGWLEETAALPYPAAHARLLTLPGVGPKVADCVLLFGAGRLAAFPVDVWMLRSLARHYGREGRPAAAVAHFGRTHFGPLAGLAQQYLFAWERAQARPAMTTLRPGPTPGAAEV